MLHKAAILIANRFQIGQSVIRKTEKTVGKIVQIQEAGVELEVEDKDGNSDCHGLM